MFKSSMFKNSMFNVLGKKALMSDCPTGLLSCSLIVLQACWLADRQTGIPLDRSSVSLLAF